MVFCQKDVVCKIPIIIWLVINLHIYLMIIIILTKITREAPEVRFNKRKPSIEREKKKGDKKKGEKRRKKQKNRKRRKRRNDFISLSYLHKTIKS